MTSSLTRFGLVLLFAGCSSSTLAPAPEGSPDGGSPSDDGGAPPSSDDAGPSPDVATEPPYSGGDVTVSVVGNPATVTGKVTIHIDATTPAALSKIDLYVDNKTIGSLTNAPFDLEWDSSLVDNGQHAISATPYDMAAKTGTAKSLSITTSNFLFAGTWNWSGITDAHTGFGTNSCSGTSFTVTFDAATSTVTFPSFSVSCSAQNGAPYSSKVAGFTKTLTPADYNGSLTDTSGYTTITLSTTTLRQVQTPFAGSSYTLSGTVAR